MNHKHKKSQAPSVWLKVPLLSIRTEERLLCPALSQLNQPLGARKLNQQPSLTEPLSLAVNKLS